ncbi:MAG TPA: hypothetical protein ENJ79_00635 [Gammaproteobacteria bacterium]|nr:hypothetical protein [Gammaproteobacteria bacterium]
MHFVQDEFDSALRIRGYDAQGIRIGDTCYRHSLIVSHRAVHADWRPRDLDALEAADLSDIPALEVELLLLGTGHKLRFPPPATTAPLLATGIGVEIMDTAAACRTFNILLSEGRPVAAALLID